jgi:hypothetical protein
MVLQRDLPVPVWGAAAPGDTVTVSFRDQKQHSQVDHDGTWQAKLDPLKAGEAGVLTITDTKDNSTVTFTDVWVGEVWNAYSPQPSYANLFNRDGLPALTFTTEPLGQAAMPSQGRWQ